MSERCVPVSNGHPAGEHLDGWPAWTAGRPSWRGWGGPRERAPTWAGPNTISADHEPLAMGERTCYVAYCPECDAVLAPDDRACPDCGADVDPRERP